MLTGCSPARIRRATPTVALPSSVTSTSRPPMMPLPSWVPKRPKIGALASECRTASARSSWCGTPRASTDIIMYRMTDRGGSAAARCRISSKESVFHQSKRTRVLNDCHSRFASPTQNLSSGVSPRTTAISVVSGSSRRMSSTAPGKSRRRLTAVWFVLRVTFRRWRWSMPAKRVGAVGNSCSRWRCQKRSAGPPTGTTRSNRRAAKRARM